MWGVVVFSTRAISDYDSIIWFPTTTARSRLPDRRWAEDRIVIWDGRLGDLLLHKSDYYRHSLPTIKDFAAHIMSLGRAYPEVPLKCTDRDINSAFRHIRLRPGAFSTSATEFRGNLLCLGYDILIGYIVPHSVGMARPNLYNYCRNYNPLSQFGLPG